MTLEIRAAVITDAESLHQVNAEELHYDYALAETQNRLAYILTKDWQKIFVASINGEFAGYVQVSEYLETYGDKMANIMGLAVLSRYQGEGVGKALMHQAELWAQEIGAKGVRLNSGEERKEAHLFYEHIGYTKEKMQAKFKKVF
ncbi:GNAT family N-acetyltransferase [Lapidilactobacillus mulanensis]|uniref:GNAT family N-acetyltransferase n=1 Tax=Lapidilactobacillus mulanensis TaxID=2485999 RepID=A0ABW4DM63_9LACO|nr:GNAT family N-acetyltransferase [Lapidilactobacillus mulanensis]